MQVFEEDLDFEDKGNMQHSRDYLPEGESFQDVDG